MRNTKKLFLALFIAISMGAFSSVSLAEKAAIPADVAIAAVVAKIGEVNALITAKGDKEEVAALIKQAKDLSKEVSANDRVDFKRQKVQGDLKKAIIEAKDGKMDAATETLKGAISLLAEMKSLI